VNDQSRGLRTRSALWPVIALAVWLEAPSPVFAHGEQVVFIVGSLGLLVAVCVAALLFSCKRRMHRFSVAAILVISAAISWVFLVPRSVGESAPMSPTELFVRATGLPLAATLGAVMVLRRAEQRNRDGAAQQPR
jgi:hypothetical protein